VRRNPDVVVEIAGHRFAGRGCVVDEAGEDERARRLVYDKYARSYAGDLSRWRRDSLPVAIDLAPIREP
jgi:hypothetical protein